jgi:alpha-ketoglutarate-dependent taurine dioxygenase
VFQTTKKTDVEDYCNKNNIQYHWHEPGSNGLELITQQICQATVKHPVTQEDVWFNQAHLFHVSSLDEADKHALLSIVTEDNLPRNVFHGDGSDIQVDDLHHILDVYQSEKIIFQWKRGDVMILDNVLMAHGRNPFIGERKIVVAMSGDE